MFIRVSLLLCFLVVATIRAEVGIGDSLDSVIQQKGTPTGKMSAGDMVILRYPGQSIRLKAGKVVALETHAGAAAVRTQPAAPSGPAETTANTVALGTNAIGLTWTTNYRAALATAKEQNRHVFLFFTGSDWCIWCKRLNNEVLSTPEFRRYAQENLVLVEVDFPREKPQSTALTKQNAALQRAFEIEGYPTVVVLNSAGRAVGKLGYETGGPRPFIKRLNDM